MTTGDDWDVTTAKGKMDAAAAQGKKDMACVKTLVDDVGTEKYNAQIDTCSVVLGELFVSSLKWGIQVKINDQNSPWNTKSCDESGMNLKGDTTKYQLSDDGNTCSITPKLNYINRNTGRPQENMSIQGQFLKSMSTGIISDLEFTFKDINDIVFNSGELTIKILVGDLY